MTLEELSNVDLLLFYGEMFGKAKTFADCEEVADILQEILDRMEEK